MKILLLIMVLSVLAVFPFVILRRRWAVVLWRRAKLVAVLYALIILTSAIVRLVFGWDDIYG
jgi:hypothetical protein